MDKERKAGDLIVDGDASGNITGDWIYVGTAQSLGIHAFSASAARGGSLVIQGSGERTPTKTYGVNLALYDYGTATTVTSLTVSALSVFNHLIGIPFCEFPYVRAVFTDSASGAGTLQVLLHPKMTGVSVR